MVRELEAYATKCPKYRYPIECEVEASDELNAYATVTEASPQIAGSKRSKPQGRMVVFTGLVEAIGEDVRLIRAVVAHEIGHLSCGHILGEAPIAEDLGQLWTRAQEAEADRVGAMLLQRAGYNKQDLVDMLLKFEEFRGRDGAWFERLTGTHPDPKARAAQFVDNPSVLRSLLSFDAALALFDRREFDLAGEMFDKAHSQEPRLREAMVNSAQCKLLAYYDGLGSDLRRSWFRPDFGAILKDPAVGKSKGQAVTQQDRARYRLAVEAIAEASKELPGHRRVGELNALAQVLEPDGKATSIRAGAEWFLATVAKITNPEERLRFATNAAVGLDRLGETKKAQSTMMAAQRQTRAYNAALAENLGRRHSAGGSKEADRLAADVMFTWLENTPRQSPNWAVVNANYLTVCRALKLRPQPIGGAPLYLAGGISIHLPGARIALLQSVDEAKKRLGQPDAVAIVDERYPDLTEMRWRGGAVSAYTNDGQLLRITSSVPGSYVELKPMDSTVADTLRVEVGVSVAELSMVLDPELGAVLALSKMGQPEEWLYYPPLSLGVRIEAGKVAAVTITPVRELEE